MKIDEQEICLAKEIYQSLSEVTSQDLGPALRPIPGSEKKFAEQKKRLDDFASDLKGHIHDQILDVPSPWHAVLYLIWLQDQLARMNQRALFRGQYNSEWEISPSISRTNDTEKEKKKGQLFCNILSSLSLNNVKVLHPVTKSEITFNVFPGSYWAAAQHYNISTNLIDFTSDPAIAVFFACQGKNPGEKQTSSIFILNRNVAMQNGCNVILPPPFVERLYIQRGVFIQSDFALDKIKLKIVEIRFPTAVQFSTFEVIRSVDKVVDVLKNSPLMDELSKITEVHYGQTTHNFEQFAKSLKGYMPEYKDPFRELIAKQVDRVEDCLYWLVYNAYENLTIDLNEIAPIISNNKGVFASMVSAYRWLEKLPPEISDYSDKTRETKGKLADLFQRVIDA